MSEPTRDELAKAAKTYQSLCVCYRIRKRPSKKLFDQMETARKTIACYEEETG